MSYSATDLIEFTSFAHTLADAARRETLPRFRAGGAVTNKLTSGFDPVTQADQMAEKAIRGLIEQHYPSHGILGEEYGETKAQSPWRWVLDPVDGTRAFICGLPTWTTLIALEYDGYPVLGLIDQPYTNDLYIGSPQGAMLQHNAKKTEISVSTCTSLSQARVTTSDPMPDIYFTAEEAAVFGNVSAVAQLTRYGLDGYGYGMLAGGGFDLVIEAGLQHYDAAALVPVVEAAGGVVTDWRGEVLSAEWAKSPDQGGRRGQIVAAASQELLEETLPLLADAAF